MCANYQPVTREDRLLSFFGVVRGEGETPDELWPLGLAPFIRRAEDGSGNRVVDNGIFGLLPGFAKELAYGRKLYNARAETVAALPSFRDSWQAGRRCIIPTETIFEYCDHIGAKLLQEGAAVTVTLRHSRNEPVLAELAKGTVQRKNSSLAAVRLSGGTASVRALIETTLY